MRICEYESNGKRCKNWITSKDDDVVLCGYHAGVVHVASVPRVETQHSRRIAECESIVVHMNNEQLQEHLTQLQTLIEDVKLRQQVAHLELRKRIKTIEANPQLTNVQKQEIETLRGGKIHRVTKKETFESKQDKEVAKLMKLGLSKEKALKMLSED